MADFAGSLGLKNKKKGYAKMTGLDDDKYGDEPFYEKD